MNAALRRDADVILRSSLNAVLPDEAVRRALRDLRPGKGRVLLVAAGKAAWQMAHAAVETLGRVDGGVVVTKYGHVKGEIPGVACYEAGHPVPDANGFAATQKALELVQGLTAGDTVLFLLSGGGSALFEQPLVPGAELQDITSQLLASGADIVEMNTIRKRLSGVKGGRFAQRCASAQVFSIVLSDILGDPLDMIASGPAVPDTSTCAQALAVAKKYHLALSAQARALLAQETPKTLDNVTTRITGSVRELCRAAASACRNLGYEPVLLTVRSTGSRQLPWLHCPHPGRAGEKAGLHRGRRDHRSPDRKRAWRKKSGAGPCGCACHCRAERGGILCGQRWHRRPHRCRRRLCGWGYPCRAGGRGLERIRCFAEQRFLPRPESSGWPDHHRGNGHQCQRCGGGPDRGKNTACEPGSFPGVVIAFLR